MTDETEARDREGPIDRMDGWRVSLRSGDVKRERKSEGWWVRLRTRDLRERRRLRRERSANRHDGSMTCLYE